jgi:hypothetical protein
MLNWDDDPDSETVDRWEIQRAAVNNVAAARLNMRNPSDFGKLSFVAFKTIYFESSRFLSAAIDVPLNSPDEDVGATVRLARVQPVQPPLSTATSTRGRDTITGDHCYMDSSTLFGNTYFYRIRSISPSGDMSGWSYRGARVTDDTFEKKLSSLMTPDERSQLAASFVEMRLKGGLLTSLSDQTTTSFGLQAGSSLPISVPSYQQKAGS